MSVLDFDGGIASASILTSASAPVGLSAALSGDVVVPTSRTPGRIVVVDRNPAAVVTWLAPETATVAGQLSLTPGTNPHDYIDVATGKAYVSRYDVAKNIEGTSAPGGDIAVLDSITFSITGRIDVASNLSGLPPDLFPHPGRMLASNGFVFAVISIYSQNYVKSGTDVVIKIDPNTDEVVGILPLSGLSGCTGFARAPDSSLLAVSCSGAFNGASDPDLASAGIGLVDVGSFSVLRIIPASALNGQALGFSLDFAGDTTLLVPTTGSLETDVPDRLLAVDIKTDTFETVATSDEAFEFGEVRCLPACGACFLANGSKAQPSVFRFAVDSASSVAAAVRIDKPDGVGLPPRSLGVY